MEVSHIHIQKLKKLVEESALHPLKTTKDFENLHWQMQERIHDTISTSTIKRLWGYIDSYETIREETLDVLCRFIGFPDYQTFVADYCQIDSEQTSHRIVSSTLSINEIQISDCLVIEWNPNRRLLLNYNGNGIFEVIGAQNSKIVVGDTFHCTRFTMNQPLYIDNLIHEDMPPALFVIGKKGGLTKIEKIEKTES